MRGASPETVVWIEFEPVFDRPPLAEPDEAPEAVEAPAPPPAASARARRWPARTLGGIFVGLGVLGVAIGVGLIVLGLSLADDITSGLGDGLEVVADVLDVSADTIDTAEATLRTVTASLGDVDAAMAEFDGGLGDVEILMGDMAVLVGGDLAGSMAGLREAMPQLITVGDTLDRTLGALAIFGVDYDPDTGMGESFREVQASIADVPEKLEGEGRLLGEAGTDLGEARVSLGRVATGLADLRTELAGTASLFTRYRVTVEDARSLVADLRQDVSRWDGVLRWALIAVGTLVVVWQLVPLHLGRRLIRGMPTPSDG